MENPTMNNQGAAMQDTLATDWETDSWNDIGIIAAAMRDVPKSIIPRNTGCAARITPLLRFWYTQIPPSPHAIIKQAERINPMTKTAVGTEFSFTSSLGSDKCGTDVPSL
mmetsp:Transcript_14903/g.34447  ORF Transcript_14903/g.34447 Transcript_14903/m.34447 type:complete len:110 (+) Transcript_14903:873-1202(+)